MYSGKLGCPSSETELVKGFLAMLEKTKADFTMSFRDLSEIDLDLVDTPCPAKHWALATVAKHTDYPHFVAKYKALFKRHGKLCINYW